MKAGAGRDPLWMPIVSPVIWAAHFMICYVWVALACGRPTLRGSIADADTGVAVVTAVASAAIGLCWFYGFHRHARRLPDEPNDDATPGDRTRFMAFTTMLLAGLSLIGTLFVGGAALAMGGCQ